MRSRVSISTSLARLVRVAARLAVVVVSLAPRRAAVAVPLAPARAVLTAPAADAPVALVALAVLVAADLACVAVRLVALRALVLVAFAPPAAAPDPLRADEERPEDFDVLELGDDDLFAAGIRRLLVDLTRWREPIR